MFLVDAATQDQPLIHGFIRQVAANLDIGAASTRVAVVSSRDPHVQIRLDDYAEKSLLLNAIDSLAQLATPGDIVSALEAVRQNVLAQDADDRQARPGIVFIVADDSLDLRDDALIGRATDIVSLTGRTRTAATLIVVAPAANIDVATNQVNLDDGSTDTVVLQ